MYLVIRNTIEELRRLPKWRLCDDNIFNSNDTQGLFVILCYDLWTFRNTEHLYINFISRIYHQPAYINYKWNRYFCSYCYDDANRSPDWLGKSIYHEPGEVLIMPCGIHSVVIWKYFWVYTILLLKNDRHYFSSHLKSFKMLSWLFRKLKCKINSSIEKPMIIQGWFRVLPQLKALTFYFVLYCSAL